MNIKPTTAEKTLLHTVLSAAVACIIAAGTTAAQYYFSNGQNLWLTLVFFAGTLGSTFAAIRVAVWHAIQTSPALPQAEKDAMAQAQQIGQQALSEVRTLASNVMPFVHQHPASAQPPAAQGRVSSAVTATTQRPITFPPAPAPAAHFGDTGVVPVPPQQ